jgi:hypothetical protein
MGPKQVHAMPDDFHPEMDQHGVGLRSVVSQAGTGRVVFWTRIMCWPANETRRRVGLLSCH